MADQEGDHDGSDAATEAFEAMRGELALLRRAVESIAADRTRIEVPDYNETLGHMSQVLRAIGARLSAIEKNPALAMTPEQMGARIEAVAIHARDQGNAALARASAEMGRVTAELRGITLSARAAEDQRDRQWWFGLGGAAIGAILCSFLPGLVARHVVPESWHWPERMAARTLDRSMWGGARQLAAVSSPDIWNTMVAGAVIGQGNQAALERCQKAATKAGAPVRCTVQIKPQE